MTHRPSPTIKTNYTRIALRAGAGLTPTAQLAMLHATGSLRCQPHCRWEAGGRVQCGQQLLTRTPPVESRYLAAAFALCIWRLALLASPPPLGDAHPVQNILSPTAAKDADNILCADGKDESSAGPDSDAIL